MRVLFCGSGRFAVPSLRTIYQSPHELVGLVTQPARPAGRGAGLRATPIAQAAAELGLDVVECGDINADPAVAAIRAARPDVICVADFGQMVRGAVRDAAAIDTINVHGSLLPKLRGAAPINWAIIRGHDKTGVTTFSLVDRMDAGDIYLRAEAPIAPDQTADQLRDTLADLGARALADTLDLLEPGTARRIGQDDAEATTAPRLKKSDGRIDWTADAVTIRNRVHGTWPWPGGQTVFRRANGGKAIPVLLARAVAEPGPGAGSPGEIDGELCVAAGSGRVRVGELKPAGKRLMRWNDFVNGYRVQPGDRFEPIET